LGYDGSQTRLQGQTYVSAHRANTQVRPYARLEVRHELVTNHDAFALARNDAHRAIAGAAVYTLRQMAKFRVAA
jgi:hypothetical protein